LSAADPREAALRRLVRDARADAPPDIDWSGAEERLLRHAQRAKPAERRSPYPLVWGALAVAATIAVWLVSQGAHHVATPAPSAIVEATEPLRRDGDAMALGSRVETGDREVSVAHAGRATWTLAPNSSALLASRGERITVHLERGSVTSQVVPNPKPETFVVEAAGARIAVHGTVFRVALEGDRVIVQVREGTVAVGPLGGVPAFFLKAPANGDFARDGRSGNIDGPPLSETQQRRAGPLRLTAPHNQGAGPAASAPAPIASAEVPNEPSINDIEVGIARIVDASADCFKRHTQSAEGVRITVRTALSFTILGSGAVANVDFQPPLSPDAETCAAASISQMTFAASKQGTKVTRVLELKR
jgi:ferric-dicitrate binding protein FerR (iron transport regulator)